MNDRKTWSANSKIAKKQTTFTHPRLRNLHLHRTNIQYIETTIKEIINTSKKFAKKFNGYSYDDKNGLFGFENRHVVPIQTEENETDSDCSLQSKTNVIQDLHYDEGVEAFIPFKSIKNHDEQQVTN